MHDTATADEDTGKPVQIVGYNCTKGGVDSRLTCSRITTSKKTQRWPINIIFRQIDIPGINSFRIFQKNKPLDKYIRRTYLYDLSLELMEENLRERAELLHLHKDLSIFLERYRERPANQPPVRVQPNQRAICHIFGSKKNHRTQLACKECGKYVCKHQYTVTCNSCQESPDEGSIMDID
jgi:hypothetical protein